MGYSLKQSQSTYPLVFRMYLSSDHITPATGKTITATLSKSGGSLAAASGAVSEIGNGYYKCAPNATDCGTLGPLNLYATGTDCDPTHEEYLIVSYDPFDTVRLGLTALPNAAAEAAGGLYTRGSGAGQINQPANGQIDANTVKVSGTAQTARDLGASVLLSPGTGTGQVDLSSGKVLLQATQTGVTIPTVTTLTGHTPQTGDSYARIGANGAGLTSVALASSQSFNNTGQTANLPADLKLWLGTAPLALSSQMVQSIVAAYATNQAPLQPTIAGRTLDVAATGEAGLDFDNVKQASGATTLTNITVPRVTLTDTLTTYTNNTPQTGDAYVRLGAPAGASIAADIADVPTVAEFNARTLPSADYFDAASDTVTVGTNNDKTNYSLTTAPPTASDIATAVWANSTRTLSSFGTLVADVATAVWGAVTRTITGGSLTTAPPTAAQIASAVWDSLTTALTAVGSIGKRLADNVDAKISEVSGGGGTGLTGPRSVTLTWHDADGIPVANVDFTITGVGAGRGNADGTLTFGLEDSETDYSVVSNTTNGVVFAAYDLTVNGAGVTATITGEAVQPPDAATSDDQCNCYLDTKDAAGTLQGGVTHLFRLSTLPTGDGSSYGPLIEATSEDDETSEDFGRLEVLLKRGATYLMQRGETWENESADQVTVEVPNNAGPFELPNVWSNDN